MNSISFRWRCSGRESLIALAACVAVAACGEPTDPDGAALPECQTAACAARCGDGACDAAESCSSCAADCGVCSPWCGDGICDLAERCDNCAADCGTCEDPGPVCGDGVCEGPETCSACAADCGTCPPVCGDGVCAGGETCASCAGDCGTCPPVCGDGACAAGETCAQCAADCGPCIDPIFGGTTCTTVDKSYPAVSASRLDEAIVQVATMGRDAFSSLWDPEIDAAQMYGVMTWVLNTLRQNGYVAFRGLQPTSSPGNPIFENDKTTVRQSDGSEITYDLFTSWQNPGTPQALLVGFAAPYETGDLMSCSGDDNGVPVNTWFPGGVGPIDPPTDLTPTDRANVLAAATYVRNNHPEFFMAEDRAVAHDMMTVVINDARARGTDAMRCLAHPSLPPDNPYRWCSDALVVGQPGLGITVDIYLAWPDPATPQILITGTQSTGEMTADLNP